MDFSKYRNQQLKACLQELKDKTTGNKQDLILRLQAHNKERVGAILAQFAGKESTSMLDTSVDAGSSEDQIAILKGEVASLNATVSSLVQSLKKLFPSTNSNSEVISEVAEGSPVTEAICANGIIQEPLISLQEQTIVARASGSGVLCTHQANQMNANVNVTHVSGSSVLCTHNEDMLNANAAVQPQAFNVVNQMSRSSVAQTLTADAMIYEPHVHGTRRVQQNYDGEVNHHSEIMFNEGYVHDALPNEQSTQPVRQPVGPFPADSTPHFGHIGARAISNNSMRNTMDVRDMVGENF